MILSDVFAIGVTTFYIEWRRDKPWLISPLFFLFYFYFC